ncbi:MAG: N-acetylgalactosamine-6-sulfatase [Acidobacteria bacterium]|nr:N-acetylgalactosamine-6-sulfatase [Acidobacteriota bacterium]
MVILADDLGSADLSCYGCPDIRTPSLDALAAAGVRFTRAYANAPECSPTRTGLMTGRYQQRAGGLECAIGVGNVGRYDEAEWLASKGQLGLPVSETSIARMLKSAGYATACAGKWHLGYLPEFSANRHGFDEYFGIMGGNADYFTHTEEDGTNVLYHNGKPVQREGHVTDLIADHAIAWLKARPKSQPYFLYVPFTAPHTPLQALGDPPAAKATWNEGKRATYVKMVEHMDRRIGELLGHIDTANTLVVFMSDNGGYAQSRNTPLKAGKSTCWEGGIRIPCIVRWPGRIPAGSTTAQVAMTMDISATLLAAASVKPPRKLDGMDLLPVMSGKSAPVPRTLFWSYKRAQTRRWAAREGDWKLVVDNGQEALHDLASDEREQHNVIAQHPDKAQRLRSLLDAWKKETAPARLRDFKPKPAA